MIPVIPGLIFAVICAIILYNLFRKLMALVINAIVGIIVLFLINVFGLMNLSGRPDILINWRTILISAIGGFPGVSSWLSSI